MQNPSSSYFDFLLKNDSGVRLLRSRSAQVTISFFYNIFREKHLQVVEADEFESMLVTFLNTDNPDEKELEEDATESLAAQNQNTQIEYFSDVVERAKLYINYWCSEERAYLRRYHNAQGQTVIELNAGIERLFNWLEDCEQTSFIGTESRFKNILQQLKDLKIHTNKDVDKRIAALQEQKDKIEREIETIKKTGEMELYTPVQISERLSDISKNSRELLSDFRQVEDNFRKIMQDIYKAQSEEDSSRGQILGYTLDTSRKLRESPQGQTFQSFWNFISQDRDNEINNLVNSIIENSVNNNSELWHDDFMLELKKYLYQAGHKVVEQNRTLTERINKLLSKQDLNERRQINVLTSQIKKGMLEYKEKLIAGKKEVEEDFMFLDGKASLSFPQTRYAVFPEHRNKAADIKVFDGNLLDSNVFSSLLHQFYIDDKVLKKHLSDFRHKTDKKQFTLKDVIDEYPIQKGLSELIAWFELAMHTDKVVITDDKRDTIQYSKNGTIKSVTVPRTIFS
ncbi:MAG: DUF3375 domain-containing protein [Treponema sp.]|nr:DUF3375 domain-containing protein [Treponema sp.]